MPAKPAAHALPDAPPFPSTRYQGSKARIAPWIASLLAPLDFDTALDAFGGTGAVAWQLKALGKAVTVNDHLAFNARIGRALIENPGLAPEDATLRALLAPRAPEEDDREGFIARTFGGIYYTDAENRWLDGVLARLHALPAGYPADLLFFALCQACLAKRPYNLFHRKNLHLRLAEVPRSFGNKATWDRAFPELLRRYLAEAAAAVFDNGRPNRALRSEVCALEGSWDLVYLDPPYVSARGQGVPYRDYYHFLEGLADPAAWPDRVDLQSRHRRLRRRPDSWTRAATVHRAFADTLAHFQSGILAVSYRSDGIPSIPEIAALLRRHRPRVSIHSYGRFRYALSKNRRAEEVLLIAR